MQQKQRVVKNAVITGVGNNIVSMMAAITIFGTVFAVLGSHMSRPEILEIMRNSGPASTGLTFIWMPQLFAQMAGGKVLAILFFVGLSFAAFSSLISMIELASRILVDLGFERNKAVGIVCGSGLVLGIPSALRLGFLGNQDFVWGVALMISGTFVAFSVARYGAERFRQEAIMGIAGDWKVGSVWKVLITYFVPIQAAVLLIWWLYLAATVYAPDTWYDPTDPYSVMTCLVQWGVALAVFIALNRRIVQKTLLPDGLRR
jgi:NSS family neurotransmitter:Na+ symporter